MCQGSGWRQEMEWKQRLLHILLTCDFSVCQLEVWGICTIVVFKALILWKEQQMYCLCSWKKAVAVCQGDSGAGKEIERRGKYFWIIQGNKGCILRFALLIILYVLKLQRMSLKILKKIVWGLIVKLRHAPEHLFVLAKKKLDKLLKLQST